MSSNNSETIDLLIDLVQRPSVTPEDHGCQQLIAARLQAIGFSIEHMHHDGVDNLWARYGTEEPVFVFAGHTDVVPTGNENDWSQPPFSANIVDGELFGRGAADMKGSVAAMITAIERFLNANQISDLAAAESLNNASEDKIKGSLAVLLTSDEEGPAVNGTVKVVEALAARNEDIHYCVVGEPTSTSTLGDTIKNGRRGSLSAKMRVHGTQGHVAYPHLADNPAHKSFKFLDEMVSIKWDEGDDNFPPTTLQISNINAGTGAGNVIPGTLTIDFNLRYSPAITVEEIQAQIKALVEKHKLPADIDWINSASPFLTPTGSLTDAMRRAVNKVVNVDAKLDTSGGTSDGRFISRTCKQVIEFGPLNATIHQTNERISCKDIDSLSTIYENLLETILGTQEH